METEKYKINTPNKREAEKKWESTYNESVQYYNEGKLEKFVTEFRSVLQWAAKAIIYDLLGEEEGLKLLEGDCMVKEHKQNKGESTYTIEKAERKFDLKGKNLILFIPKILKIKNFSDRNDIRSIESCVDVLARTYDYGSEGLHAKILSYSLLQEVAPMIKSLSTLFFTALINNGYISENLKNKYIQLNSFNNTKLHESLKMQIEDIKNQLMQTRLNLEIARKSLNTEDSNGTVSEKDLRELEESLDDLIESYKEMNPESKDVNTQYKFAVGKLDEDQTDILNALPFQKINGKNGMLISGSAGSGKSIVATILADKLAKKEKKVTLIAYTKSLRSFMKTSEQELPYELLHYEDWNKKDIKSSDYIIVDEIQDFTKEVIDDFIENSREGYVFVGDSAQSIYKQYRNTLDIETIEEEYDLHPMTLYYNYRLPREVARITHNVFGTENDTDFNENEYMNSEGRLPYFIKYGNKASQLKDIISLLEQKKDIETVGILLPTNDDVKEMCQMLEREGIVFEFKYNEKEEEKEKSKTELHFNNRTPKVMTYHSAKGLQFDNVIIPMSQEIREGNKDDLAALYVAMTRTMHCLYVMYITAELGFPLNKVNRKYYNTSL